MKLIRGLEALKTEHRGCVLTLGNFDGVHRGHQALIKRLKRMSLNTQCPSMVMTFEPSPAEFFAPDRAPVRLMKRRDKYEALRALGVDRLLCVRFNKTLASLSAEAFVETVLHRDLGVRQVLVGDDLRFGRGRAGDIRTLKSLGKQYGFTAEAMDVLTWRGRRVSSTRVRACLKAGRLSEVKALLGRPYSVSGRVIHGDKIGRTWGFPTVNIPFYHNRLPLSGVFVVRVAGVESGRDWPGVASVGIRPTVGGTQPLLEVFLLDFDGDLYGRLLRVQFLHKLRDEINYSEVEALKKQIAQDVEEAQSYID